MTAVDPGRLARAIHLDVEPTGAGIWSVTGGRTAHVVTRAGCDCVDGEVHPEQICKHRLAVVLARLSAEIREALRELVPSKRAETRRPVAQR
jgi:hypothetical protein